MFSDVIVGVDGSDGGRDAIALARAIADPRTQMTLVHVDRGLPAIDSPAALPSSQRAAAEGRQLLEAERVTTDIDAELVAVGASSVGRGLHEVAEKRHADLLVVGSCHRGFLGRVFVGDDTRNALNGAPCAVAVAPRGYASDLRPIATVGVGYDASPESKAALELARRLAAEHDASLRALHVVPIPVAPYAMGGSGWGEVLQDILKNAQQELAGLEGADAEAVLGLAGEELAAFGERVDLLVVGSRGFGPLRRMMLGSTSEHLTRHARSPLLVLPRAATAPQQPAPTAQETSAGALA